ENPYEQGRKRSTQKSRTQRTTDLHVEHVVPRCRRPELAEEWTNFLLACSNCNGIKQNRNHSRDGYIWPDSDDTQAAFEYLPDGIVKVQHDLPAPERARATRLYELVGLGRTPTADPRARDMRWLKRRAAWRQAEEARQKLEDGADVVGCVIRLAVAIGFWSVWITVFAGHPQVRDLLRQHFPGSR
ncbi:MAG: HNH endonuclease, partial [Acidobacteriota bacterium]|nr:HNH endonuclease [Acidobacteriota bacterium]